MLDPAAAAAVTEARSHDPFAVLGQHRVDGGWEIRAFLPGARSAFVATGKTPAPMERVDDRGLFVRRAARAIRLPYRLIEESGGARRETYDPYAFPPQLRPRHGYRIGVPRGGEYHELFNSDAAHYGGSNAGNFGRLRAEGTPYMGRTHSLVLTVPPLAGMILAPAS